MASCLEECLHHLGGLGGLFLHTHLLNLEVRVINGLLLIKVVIKVRDNKLGREIPRTRVRAARMFTRRSWLQVKNQRVT
jgi:hypothetical protein